MQAIKISLIQEGVSFFDGMTAHYLVDEMTDFDVRSNIKWLMAESLVMATDLANDIKVLSLNKKLHYAVGFSQYGFTFCRLSILLLLHCSVALLEIVGISSFIPYFSCVKY